MAELLRAGVALLRGQRGRALDHVERARARFDEGEARLLSAAAQYCRGSLVGGRDGAQLQARAFAAFAGEGVVEPRRYIAWIAPGFRQLILEPQEPPR